MLSNKKDNYKNSIDKPNPHIKLYEGFYGKDLMFDFSGSNSKYLRDIIKINLKSLDLYLPLQNDGLDHTRGIEIWNIGNGDNITSISSDFYNSFTESNFAKKASSAKYKLIIGIKAGNKIKLNLSEPVKKVFIYARV